MNTLQLQLLALHDNAPEMADAIKSGVFYGNATVLGTHHVALSLTNLPDGTSFPCLFATQAQAQADLDDEVEIRREAIEAGELDGDEDDDDFDLAVVEVRWNGGTTFEVDGRSCELNAIQQGSF